MTIGGKELYHHLLNEYRVCYCKPGFFIHIYELYTWKFPVLKSRNSLYLFTAIK
jgi:hypothetical protein